MPKYSLCHSFPSLRKRSVFSSGCPEGDTDSRRQSYWMRVGGNGAQSCHLPNGWDSELQETRLAPWVLSSRSNSIKEHKQSSNQAPEATYQQAEIGLQGLTKCSEAKQWKGRPWDLHFLPQHNAGMLGTCTDKTSWPSKKQKHFLWSYSLWKPQW